MYFKLNKENVTTLNIGPSRLWNHSHVTSLMTSPINAMQAVVITFLNHFPIRSVIDIGHKPLNGLVSEISSVKVADRQTRPMLHTTCRWRCVGKV